MPVPEGFVLDTQGIKPFAVPEGFVLDGTPPDMHPAHTPGAAVAPEFQGSPDPARNREVIGISSGASPFDPDKVEGVRQFGKDVAGVVAKAGAGLVKGTTLGAVNPEKGTVGIPFTDKQYKVAPPLGESLQEVIGTSPEIAKNPYIGLGPEYAIGMQAPWGVVSRGLSTLTTTIRGAVAGKAISQAAPVARTVVGKALDIGGRVAHQAATGAIVGAAENISPEEDRATRIASTALMGAGGQLVAEGIRGIAMAGGVAKQTAYQAFVDDLGKWAYGEKQFATPEAANSWAAQTVTEIIQDAGGLKNVTIRQARRAAAAVRNATKQTEPVDVTPENMKGATNEKGYATRQDAINEGDASLQRENANVGQRQVAPTGTPENAGMLQRNDVGHEGQPLTTPAVPDIPAGFVLDTPQTPAVPGVETGTEPSAMAAPEVTLPEPIPTQAPQPESTSQGKFGSQDIEAAIKEVENLDLWESQPLSEEGKARHIAAINSIADKYGITREELQQATWWTPGKPTRGGMKQSVDEPLIKPLMDGDKSTVMDGEVQTFDTPNPAIKVFRKGNNIVVRDMNKGETLAAAEKVNGRFEINNFEMTGEARIWVQQQMQKAVPSGTVFQSTIIPGAKEFTEQDVMPAMKSAGAIIKDAADQFRKVFTPAARTEGSMNTALNLRELGSRKARKLDTIARAIEPARAYFDRNGGTITDPNSRAYQFIVNTEQGSIDSLPEIERPFAQMNYDIFDDLLKEVRKRGKLQGIKTTAEQRGDPESNFQAYYFPRLWKDPKAAENVLAQIVGKRPFEGTRAFSKRRTIALFEDGIKAGLQPVYNNPIDMVYHKASEISKWIMAQDWIAGEKAAGRIKFVRLGKKPAEGWKQLDDRFATVYSRGENGEIILRGHYYAPEASATVFNNLVSQGLRGSAAFRGYLGAANVMNQFQLGFSAFHAGFTSLDAMISSFSLGLRQLSHGELRHALRSIMETPIAAVSNVVRGAKMIREWDVSGSTTRDVAKLIELAQIGGARAKMDKFYHVEMTKKMLQAFRSGNIIGAVLRFPFAGVETAIKPVLEWLVPRQKMGLIAQAAKYEIERNPNMTHEEMQKIMAKIVDSVDNRMGQLIYDNLFWNATAKDLSMASVRSVGWNLGTIREVIGGGKDFLTEGKKVFQGKRPDMTYRMSYVIGLPVLVGILGAVYQYLATGKGPKELKDYYFPKTGTLDAHGRPERVSLPSYMKDLYHYSSDPGQTVKNKLHPMLSTIAEMLANKDFYGVEIRHEDDPTVMQILQLTKHAGKSLEPFAIRGLRRNMELGETGVKAALPFIGITPAPANINKTKAEILADEFRADRMPKGTRTTEEYDRSKTAARLTRDLRMNAPEAGQRVSEAFSKGEISRSQLRDIIQHSTMEPIQIAFAPLSYDEATKVMEIATDEEKNLLTPMYLRKKSNYVRNDPVKAGNRAIRYQ